jgi:hypothetical protein
MRMSAFLALPLVLLGAAPALAHADSPGSLPLTPTPIRLKHQRPGEIVALFARERLPDAAGERLPRAARADTAESLLPPGIDAVLRASGTDEVVLVGMADSRADLEDCIQVIDVPVERKGPDRERMVLTLKRGNAQRVLQPVLRLPGAGSAAVTGQKVVLEGKPGWLHRALRQVIRAELNVPETPDTLTP